MSQKLLEALARVIIVQEGLAEFNGDDTLEVALDRASALQLGIPELTTFTTSAQRRDGQFISYNSEIFPRCETLLANQGNLVGFAVRYPDYIKQSGFDKLIAETIIPLNGLIRVGESKRTWTPYLLFNFAYTAEADEKRLGKVSFWLNGLTGVADVEIGTALLWDSDRIEIPADLDFERQKIWQIAHTVAEKKIAADITPWRHSLQRKLNRDEQRITEYYQTITSEINNKCHRKQLAGEALEKELSRIEATNLELRRKLKDLQQRYTLSVSANVHSILLVWLETMVIDCELKRKKQTRPIQLVYNPYSKSIEPRRCELTGKPVYKFFLDSELKIIAEEPKQ